uniref:Uncharacterized protein n=1 Tax=Myotis myotis TaxID=51298 RepID=A0A7J7YDP3_MYOMY|nr:hypothetical protein mMyoMyo1_010957 [Myotis myotis]
MQAEEGGAGGAAEDGEGQASSGDPGNQDGPGGHEGPERGGSGEAGAEDNLATQVALAILASGVVADDWSEPGGQDGATGRHLLQFYLMVPFPSPMEAEMASRLLMPHVRSQEGPGVKEVTVSDSQLTVRLTGEDPFAIRDYILFCLDQLSLMAFPPCFYIEPTLEKGT